MSFIGVITEKKKEAEIRQALNKQFEKIGVKHTIILINKNSIQNMKNIKFEVLIIDINRLQDNEYLINIIQNANKLIVNLDYAENLIPIENLKLNVITYGMNSKATLTISSTNNDYILVALQRSIKNAENMIVEPQEIKIYQYEHKKNLYINMILAIFLIIYDKN